MHLRKLNEPLKCKIYRLPKIKYIFLKIKVCRCSDSFDINMDCYPIKLFNEYRNLCKILVLWGGYEYLKLFMGAWNSL